MIVIAAFLIGHAHLPIILLTMRSVNTHCKPLALSVQLIFIRLISYIPVPVILGHFIDRTCLRWSPPSRLDTGQTLGACLFYDLDLFHITFISVICVLHALSCCFVWTNYFAMKRDPAFSQQFLLQDSKEGELARKLSVAVVLQPLPGSLVRLHAFPIHLSQVTA